MARFDNKVVLVSGGARGQGAAQTASKFVEQRFFQQYRA
jgi:hypothetical protein